MQKNQKGFTHFAVVLLVLLLAVVGFAGWNVQQQNKQNKADPAAEDVKLTKKNSVAESTSTKPVLLPEGWTEYKNTEYGFAFYYPKEYGSFTKGTVADYVSDRVASVFTSETPKTPSVVNSAGAFNLSVYKTSNPVFQSNKYGPDITLKNDKWIVSDLRGQEADKNKVGSEFVDYDGKAVMPTAAGGLSIYTFQTCDEGTICDHLVFQHKGTLFDLAAPTFESGYGNLPAQDTTAFTEMITTVIESFRSL